MFLFFQLITCVFLLCFVSGTPIESPQASPIPAQTAAVGIAVSTPAPVKCGQREWAAAKTRLRSLIADNSEQARWPARLLRAGFHDCYEGSCDGSLAHELSRPENSNIDVTVDLLRSSIQGSCVTLADAIKIGLELSMEMMGAPELSCPKGTVDATEAGPTGEIPLQGQDAATILSNFRSKGFTVQEALAGNFGGHSVGGFGRTPFTPTIQRYGNEFAQFMTQSIRDPTGFNAIASDQTLLDVDVRGNVERFASDRAVLDNAFARFMRKLCRMGPVRHS